MVLFNYSTRELTAKVVYYGPGICGKTTNLQYIHENLPGEVRGKMLSLATKTDRTLFFDFLPIDLGEIRGMKTRVQLYTVPGQVFYNETRKLVLKGVDGIVFVADSQETMLGANVESFRNLEENLKAHGMKLADMPHVIQFNKRDLPKLSAIEDMNAAVNKYNAPFYESVATTGIGVQDTLKAIVKLVLLNLTKKYETKSVAESAGATASMGVAAPQPARVAMAVARAAEPETAPVQAKRAPAPKAKPAPKAAEPPPPPVETMAPFAESEIDGLVGEVEEMEPVMTAPAPIPVSAPAPVPAMAAAPAAAAEEEGAWMGLPEDGEPTAFADGPATYGANVALEDLLDKQAPDVPAVPVSASPVGAGGGEFEIDRGFDPEWAQPEPAAASIAPPADDFTPIAPFPFPGADAEDDHHDRDLRLTEVASDDDLFTDPSLEIAHLADGEGREIVVPVVLGEGPQAKRYKLSIRMRLDSVD